jgi:hypothetical protein
VAEATAVPQRVIAAVAVAQAAEAAAALRARCAEHGAQRQSGC